MLHGLILRLTSSLRTTTVAVALLGLAGVLGVAYSANPVSANLNATAFNTAPLSITTGTLNLTLAAEGPGAGFTSTITGMVPGDVQYRYVTYTQGSGAASSPTLQIADAGSLLTTDAVRGLSVVATNCSAVWTYTVGVSVPSCTGVTTPMLAATPLSTLKAAPVGFIASSFLLTVGAINHVQYTITLPVGTDETVANGGLPTVGLTPYAISGITTSAGVVTYTVPSTTGLLAGSLVTVAGATPAFNGLFTMATVTGTTFTVTSAATGVTSTGTASLGSIQNLTAAITWTVSESQRTATTTNA